MLTLKLDTSGFEGESRVVVCLLGCVRISGCPGEGGSVLSQ